MDALTDNDRFFFAALAAVTVFYFAAIVLVLKIFRLVVAESQDWAHRIMFVTAAASMIATCEVLNFFSGDYAKIFALCVPFIWLASLLTKRGNALARLLNFLSEYADKHDTSRGRFCGFVVEVWRTATFIITNFAVGLIYFIR